MSLWRLYKCLHCYAFYENKARAFMCHGSKLSYWTGHMEKEKELKLKAEIKDK